MSITATELKQNLGYYLSLAATDTIYITKNGKEIAVLSPPGRSKMSALNSLIGIIPDAAHREVRALGEAGHLHALQDDEGHAALVQGDGSCVCLLAGNVTGDRVDGGTGRSDVGLFPVDTLPGLDVGFIGHMWLIVDLKPEDIVNAVESDMSDYEDAVIAATAKRNRIDFIITRNTKDFKESPVPVLTPSQFIETSLKAGWRMDGINDIV